MDPQIHIIARNWLDRYRPELTNDDKAALAASADKEIAENFADISAPGKSITVNTYMYENYYHSAYRLVRGVFEEEFPTEFVEFKKTPILSDLVEGILDNCVFRGIMPEKTQMYGSGFYDAELQAKIAPIIREAIS